MTTGTFNVARAIWEHPVFAPSPFSEREAFLWLVSEAAWKPRTARAGRVIVDLERGQLCASIRFMAEAWGWSKSRVERYLKRLENHAMICAKSGTGQMVLTIQNYNEYQHPWDSGGTQAGHKRDTSGTNYKKEISKEGIDIEPKGSIAKKPRASRLSHDWFLPKDWGEWALGEGLSQEQIRLEADKFKDYWTAKSGVAATKTDWQATWRNWIRNANHGNRTNNGKAIPQGRGNGPNAAIARIADIFLTGEPQSDAGGGVGSYGSDFR
jgi:hypothetical protein